MSPMHAPVDRLIATLAARQHGNITYHQLLELGLSRYAIQRRVSAGRLFRVYRGVYAVGRPPKADIELAAAAVLACGSNAVLSHFSALALWGLADQWPAWPELTLPTADDRRPRGIHAHRSTTLHPTDRRRHRGIRTTSPARTLLDCAPRMTYRALTRSVNDALIATHLRRDHLADLLSRQTKHPGARLLHRFIDTADAPTRSMMEDEFEAFCERFNLPRPQINTRVCGYEVDAYFAEHKLIVELDGYAFHSSRQAFERDRNRDADILAHGISIVRVTWERITERQAEEAERLERILRSRRPT